MNDVQLVYLMSRSNKKHINLTRSKAECRHDGRKKKKKKNRCWRLNVPNTTSFSLLFFPWVLPHGVKSAALNLSARHNDEYSTKWAALGYTCKRELSSSLCACVCKKKIYIYIKNMATLKDRRGPRASATHSRCPHHHPLRNNTDALRLLPLWLTSLKLQLLISLHHLRGHHALDLQGRGGEGGG